MRNFIKWMAGLMLLLVSTAIVVAENVTLQGAQSPTELIQVDNDVGNYVPIAIIDFDNANALEALYKEREGCFMHYPNAAKINELSFRLYVHKYNESTFTTIRYKDQNDLALTGNYLFERGIYKMKDKTLFVILHDNYSSETHKVISFDCINKLLMC